jgi:hypothetical protein
MIEFRCWYCNRKHSMPQGKVGEQFRCSCSNELRVPRYSGGKCRVKTLADWAVEAVVYGGGGGLLGAGFGMLLLTFFFYGLRGVPLAFLAIEWSWIVIGGPAAVGFLIGLLFGERGINWIGRMIRGIEDDRW